MKPLTKLHQEVLQNLSTVQIERLHKLWDWGMTLKQIKDRTGVQVEVIRHVLYSSGAYIPDEEGGVSGRPRKSLTNDVNKWQPTYKKHSNSITLQHVIIIEVS